MAGVTRAQVVAVVIPPPPQTPQPPHGTPQWADWVMQNNLDEPTRNVVAALILLGLTPWPSLWRARGFYSTACQTYRWTWQARLVWDILTAIIKPQEDEDIPF